MSAVWVDEFSKKISNSVFLCVKSKSALSRSVTQWPKNILQRYDTMILRYLEMKSELDLEFRTMSFKLSGIDMRPIPGIWLDTILRILESCDLQNEVLGILGWFDSIQVRQLTLLRHQLLLDFLGLLAEVILLLFDPQGLKLVPIAVLSRSIRDMMNIWNKRWSSKERKSEN